jgi:hypothetical protein
MQTTSSKAAVGRRKAGKSALAFWTRDLPRQWRAMAVAPLDFTLHRDYEADAVRAVGTDEDGLTCFTAHRFVLGEIRCDDDDDFYTVVAYGESLSAWRLRDGRWLIRRVVVREGEIERGRAFYSFGESMPR